MQAKPCAGLEPVRADGGGGKSIGINRRENECSGLDVPNAEVKRRAAFARPP